MQNDPKIGRRPAHARFQHQKVTAKKKKNPPSSERSAAIKRAPRLLCAANAWPLGCAISDDLAQLRLALRAQPSARLGTNFDGTGKAPLCHSSIESRRIYRLRAAEQFQHGRLCQQFRGAVIGLRISDSGNVLRRHFDHHY